jgi:hypothetical protein
MSATAQDVKISTSVSLIPAPAIAETAGPIVYLLPEGTSPIVGGVAKVTSAAGVAALLAADRILAQGAADMTAAFLQVPAPAAVWVSTYASGDDAADAASQYVANSTVRAENGHRGGFMALGSRADADIEILAGWIAGDTSRRLRWIGYAGCDTADLLTAGKPSSLEDAEIQEQVVIYHQTDAQPAASVMAARIGAISLRSGPVAAQTQVRGCTAASVTPDEAAALLANDGCTILQVGAGSSADDRMVVGTKTYGGASLSGLVSIAYLCRRVDDAVIQTIREAAASGRPIKADTSGAGIVRAAVGAVLDEMAQAGHWTPAIVGGVPYPEGWSLEVIAANGFIDPQITVLVGREAQKYRITTLGREV